MVITKTLCDRCGGEIEGTTHPPRLIEQHYVVSEKVVVKSEYKKVATIHLCDDCQKSFKEFMNYER